MLIVIDNLPSNKLNFIRETTMRGDNVILKKYESNDNRKYRC